jgi:hypothetical protein
LLRRSRGNRAACRVHCFTRSSIRPACRRQPNSGLAARKTMHWLHLAIAIVAEFAVINIFSHAAVH